MKKYIYTLIIVFIFLSFENVKSQGFTFTPLGSSTIVVPYIPDSIRVVQLQGIVKNTSASTLNFRFARIVNDLPVGWDTQMCYDLCYAPFIDTISLPDDPPYSILPNHEDTLFYVDFTCSGQGLGTAVIRMYNTDDPSLFVENIFKVQVGDVGITNISSIVDSYELSQNYPNPFNPNTNINFSIPKSERVSLKVYDVLGNEVASLVNNELISAGKYRVDFNGSGLSSGIYYYSIKTESFIDTKKMILVK